MEALSPPIGLTTSSTGSHSIFANWGGLFWVAVFVGLGSWALLDTQAVVRELAGASAPRGFAVDRALRSPAVSLFGLSALSLLCAIGTIVTGRGNPLRSIMGLDGRLSVSKFQFLLWTGAAAYCYVMLYAARVIVHNDFTALTYIPGNMLLAMGLSLGTALGAKAITVSHIENGTISKLPATSGTINASDLVNTDDDAATPDLTKIQLIFWTLVAVTTYCLGAQHGLAANIDTGRLPDIDTALMVLMGLGQGGYLGAKFVTTAKPRFLTMTPSSGKAGTTITVSGADLGPGGVLMVDGMPYWGSTQPVWSNEEVIFELPAPIGQSAWTPNKLVTIGGRSGGKAATSTLVFVTT